MPQLRVAPRRLQRVGMIASVPPRPPVEAVLFDFGGVLVELDWARMFAHWARHAGIEADALRERFRFDEHYQRHERGEIDAAAYFESLRRSLGIALDDAGFEAGWGAIFPGEIEGIRPVVVELAKRVPLYVFSNTNPTHHRQFARQFAELLAPFRHVFTSTELGKRKPTPEAFHAVAQAIDVPPERILFFVDTLENCHAPLKVAMPAVHVRALPDSE